MVRAVDEWASWCPQIKAVHCVGRRLRPGMTGTVESVAGIRAAFVVAVIDDNRRIWTWTSQAEGPWQVGRLGTRWGSQAENIVRRRHPARTPRRP
ncbi:hypothetical protein [Streptomyces sp. DT195]|uniref:hypothetical protein n=1 Tax=Streptomyces sp. DT195 TaxID=3393419 RepID=UPI003CEFB791